jgi:hypothetical protein
MKTYSTIFFFLLVNVVSGVNAQELLKVPDHANSRPLNLAMRKLAAPAADPAVLPLGNEAVTEGQATPGSDELDRPVGRRYGSGYESRQQGAPSGEGGAGAGGAGAGSGGKSSGGEGNKGGKGGSDGGGHGGKGESGHGS